MALGLIGDEILHKLKMAATHIKALESIQGKNGHFELEKMQYGEFDDDKSDCTKYISPSCIIKDGGLFECIALQLSICCIWKVWTAIAQNFTEQLASKFRTVHLMIMHIKLHTLLKHSHPFLYSFA